MLTRLSVLAVLLTGITAIASDNSIKPVTFNRDVLPIVQKNCQTCHRPGQVAPMSLLTYQDARPWAKAMKLKVVSRQMPPWNADPQYGRFANDRSLKQSEIDTIAAWVDQGAPEGNPKDKPAPVKWPEAGWQIQPDMIVSGPETKVPAHTPNNVIEWTYYVMPGGFTRDTWITSMEIKPSDFSVTHHICISFVPHRSDYEYNVPYWRDVQRDDKGVEIPEKSKGQRPTALAAILNGSDTDGECYLPGTQPIDYRPLRAGKLIKAGTDVVFNVHYTPNGKESVDRPQVGFTVAKQEPDRKYLTFSAHGSQDRDHFAIPPNDGNWAPPDGLVTFTDDVELVWMSPHMHLRGKDMVYTVTYPDGKSEVLLSVPHFDFNWQLGYVPAEPIKLPRGSKLVVTGHFDNSVSNRFNPDPNQTVYYGNMVWEEMFGGRTGIIVDKSVDPKKIMKEQTPERPAVVAANGG
jgi:hypothetical protein